MAQKKQEEQKKQDRPLKWAISSGTDLDKMINDKYAEETLLVKDMELDKDRDFTAEAIHVRSESMDGGHHRVFLIERGTLFIEAEKLDDVLNFSNCECDGDDLIDSWSPEETRRFSINSERGLHSLCIAANGYSGIETSYSTLVQIGLPGPDDTDEHFYDDKPVFYPADTSLWAILRNICRDFNDTPEKNPKEAISYDDYRRREMFSTSPFEGMSRDIRTRADLVNIYGFSQLERDAAGNPKVYEHEYEHVNCDEVPEDLDKYDAPVWSVLSTCEAGIPDACPECGHEISPRESRWIGPKEEELIAMWKSFPALEESEPGPEPGI